MPKNPRRVRNRLCDWRFGTSTAISFGCNENGRKCVVRVCDAGVIEDCTQSWPMRGVPLGMHRMNPEHPDPDPSDRSTAGDILLREEPDDEEDDEEKHDRDEENDDPDEGYSE
jgi:hypothetical protein